MGFIYCLYVFPTGPTAPRSFMVVDVGDTTVTLSWMPPDPPNGIITDYRVRYRRHGSTSDSDYVAENVGTVLTYTVTNLMTGTEYELQVRAFTVVGNGMYSDLVFAQPGKLK